MPLVSVVMPVYNGKKHLKEAIQSILNQSFKDFEFIIINDGSTDGTEDIIKSFGDKRIVYIKNTANRGLSTSFNIGIRLARGAYIARMDSDDISVHDRFEKQLEFMDNNPDIGIVGSSVRIINDQESDLGKAKKATKHIEIKWASLFSTPLSHPTVMARSEVLKENQFDESMTNSDDYELWSRLLFQTETRFANIAEPLLLYRVTSDSFTRKLNPEKRKVSALNTIRNLERYIELSDEEKETLILLRQEAKITLIQLKQIFTLYRHAARAFVVTENIRFPENLSIYSRLIDLALFLFKYKIKSVY